MPKIPTSNAGSSAPRVLLATGVGPPDAFAKGMTDPTVRLAHGPGAQGDNVLLGRNGVAPMADDSLPGLLVSYYYLPQFLENRHRYHYRDWVMDSGAFSAHNSGVEIKLQDYINCCKELMVSDPSLVEIYSLDVIGDWKGSLKNTEEMWAQGVPAIPCYHVGEPWDALTQMAKEFPKIALGGIAGSTAPLAKQYPPLYWKGKKVSGLFGQKLAWASQCFSKVWPKAIHGFAFASEISVLTLPWHSTDSTSWETGPCQYGRWRSMQGAKISKHGRVVTKGVKLSVRGSAQNLRPEVEYYLDLEKRARARWKKEMEKIEELGPTVRLARAGPVSALVNTLGESLSPSIRLAESGGGVGGKRQEAKVDAFAAPKPKKK